MQLNGVALVVACVSVVQVQVLSAPCPDGWSLMAVRCHAPLPLPCAIAMRLFAPYYTPRPRVLLAAIGFLCVPRVRAWCVWCVGYVGVVLVCVGVCCRR